MEMYFLYFRKKSGTEQQAVYSGKLIPCQGRRLCRNCFCFFLKMACSKTEKNLGINSFLLKKTAFLKPIGVQKGKQEVRKIISVVIMAK